ncbi:MAG TPA: glycerophosphodiester phosphodiesterase family protein [Pyrinomonadaceae bacterium]
MTAPLIIGHRGASALSPENTLAAFRLSASAKADGIEFDVRLTNDGVPVVIHDDNLKRTGNINLRVAELTLAELKEIDVGSFFTRGDFAGEKVPTLFEVFELFKETSATLYLEMKSAPTQLDSLARTCCDALAHSSLQPNVVVECFELAGIERVKEFNSEIRTAALFEPTLKHPPLIGSAKAIIEKAQAVGADEIALHHSLANTRTIDLAQETGLQVVVWTVDDPDWISRARAQNIKALITNNPALLVQQRDNPL